jgi:hypothetical protein
MEKRVVEEEGGQESSSLVSIYDQVYFKKFVSSSWLEKPAPLFLPPAAFSRMDLPQDYQV